MWGWRTAQAFCRSRTTIPPVGKPAPIAPACQLDRSAAEAPNGSDFRGGELTGRRSTLVGVSVVPTPEEPNKLTVLPVREALRHARPLPPDEEMRIEGITDEEWEGPSLRTSARRSVSEPESVVIDTMALAAIINTARNPNLAASYRSVIAGRKVLVSFKSVTELRYGAAKANWGELGGVPAGWADPRCPQLPLPGDRRSSRRSAAGSEPEALGTKRVAGRWHVPRAVGVRGPRAALSAGLQGGLGRSSRGGEPLGHEKAPVELLADLGRAIDEGTLGPVLELDPYAQANAGPR